MKSKKTKSEKSVLWTTEMVLDWFHERGRRIKAHDLKDWHWENGTLYVIVSGQNMESEEGEVDMYSTHCEDGSIARIAECEESIPRDASPLRIPRSKRCQPMQPPDFAETCRIAYARKEAEVAGIMKFAKGIDKRDAEEMRRRIWESDEPRYYGVINDDDYRIAEAIKAGNREGIEAMKFWRSLLDKPREN